MDMVTPMRETTEEAIRRMKLFSEYGGTLPLVVSAAAARAQQHLQGGRVEQALIMLVAVCDGLVPPGIQDAINTAAEVYDDTMTVTPVVYDPEDRSDLPVRVDGMGAGRITAYVEPTPTQLTRRFLKYLRESDCGDIRHELVHAQLMLDAGDPVRALRHIVQQLETLDAEAYAPMIAQAREVTGQAGDDHDAITVAG